jgi:hypothetical protein
LSVTSGNEGLRIAILIVHEMNYHRDYFGSEWSWGLSVA